MELEEWVRLGQNGFRHRGGEGRSLRIGTERTFEIYLGGIPRWNVPLLGDGKNRGMTFFINLCKVVPCHHHHHLMDQFETSSFVCVVFTTYCNN